LDLSFNIINSISTNAFNGLSDLKSIYLNNNLLDTTSLAINAFSGGLKSLNFVSLYNNPSLTYINTSSFDINSPIVDLEWPHQSQQCSVLVNSGFNDCNDNGTQFNQSFMISLGCPASTCEQLNITDPKYHIKSIKPYVFMSYFLKFVYLRISYQVLYYVNPQTFNGCYRLATLDLSYNLIDSLENSFNPTYNGMVSLQTLILSHNNIETVKNDTFVAMANLQTLDLSNCRLSILEPLAFRNTINLKTVFLNNNRLSSLPSSLFGPFYRQSKISEVSLYNNWALTTIKTEFFTGRINIQVNWPFSAYFCVVNPRIPFNNCTAISTPECE